MSENQPGLDRKPVVAVVLVVLAIAVVVVNLKVFGPGRRQPRDPEVRVQAHPAMPNDLEQTLRDVAQPALTLGSSGSLALPRLGRDPFVGRRFAAAPELVEDTPEVVVPDGPAPLSCSAVVLGGPDPIALIGGRTVRAGDMVKDYTVVGIDVHGVSLRGGEEGSLFLPVRVEVEPEGRGHAGGGLVEYMQQERKSP